MIISLSSALVLFLGRAFLGFRVAAEGVRVGVVGLVEAEMERARAGGGVGAKGDFEGVGGGLEKKEEDEEERGLVRRAR